eukprot:3550570-Prymnesium_polylepis.3
MPSSVPRRSEHVVYRYPAVEGLGLTGQDVMSIVTHAVKVATKSGTTRRAEGSVPRQDRPAHIPWSV